MKNKEILTRKELKKKLLKYASKRISLVELRNWSDRVMEKDLEFGDWESDDSLINEIIHIIDLSDIDGLSRTKSKKIANLLDSKLSTKELIKNLYKINEGN